MFAPLGSDTSGYRCFVEISILKLYTKPPLLAKAYDWDD